VNVNGFVTFRSAEMGHAMSSGGAWTPVPPSILDALSGVFAVAPDDIWAAGGNGRIVHYDGTAWSLFESGTGLGLDSVWASGPHDVWVVRSDGAVLHHR
jgi:hypothetical protein